MAGIIFLILQLLIAGLFVYLCVGFITGAPFVPSTQATTNSMVEEARLTKGMTIYDLGSGDGRVLFAAAKKGVIAIGIEMNPYLVTFTKLKAFFSPYRKNIQCHIKNLWTADVHDADAVFVYLLPWNMDKLENKLITELRPGTRVVCNSFIFPNLKKIRENTSTHVYVFQTPKK